VPVELGVPARGSRTVPGERAAMSVGAAKARAAVASVVKRVENATMFAVVELTCVLK
jgi:hypothetical protein